MYSDDYSYLLSDEKILSEDLPYSDVYSDEYSYILSEDFSYSEMYSAVYSSAAPSAIPSVTPSAVPSTATPSDTPSAAPSAHPTNVNDTNAPTFSPSAVPSEAPSAVPSTVPSNAPSAVPSSAPSDTPSSAPSAVPSTATPSDTPSAAPSAHPTNVNDTNAPTFSPSAVPSEAPSAVPSTVPSNAPTAVPSSAPSDTPSSAPSAVPSTATPSDAPSAAPSARPTKIDETNAPTFAPSAAPSNVPSAVPTSAPSDTPSSAPSAVPSTAAPSDAPSAAPSARPTNVNDTNAPTFAPSAAPSNVPSAVPSSAPSDTPSSAPSTTPSDAPTATPSVVPSTVTPSVSPSAAPSAHPTNVNDTNSPTFYPSAAPSATPSAVPSAVPSAIPTCAPSVLPTSHPTSEPSAWPSSQPTILKTYFPHLKIENVIPNRTEIALEVNLTKPGILTCLATLDPAIVTISLIRSMGTAALVLDSSDLVNLVLPNLSPSTNYSIFCFAEDLSGHEMDEATMLRSRVFGETLCCSAIKFTETHFSIKAGGDSSVFRFVLDTLPVKDVLVNAYISPKDCTSPVSTSTGYAIANPRQFLFKSSSTSLEGSFTVTGESSCYDILLNATTDGEPYYPAVTELAILYENQPTPAPFLSSARFSDDGRKIYIQFNSDSDKAFSTLTSYATVFTCSDLFSYDGASSDTCVWTSSSLVTATLSYSATGANIDSGEYVYLNADMLRAVCSGSVCVGFSFSPRHGTPVLAPSNAITPIVSLSVSPGSTVSSCSSISLNPTQTSGDGSRPWSLVSWTVSGSGAASISTLLSTSYSSGTNGIIVIPNSKLAVGTFVFTLQVRNFLGKTSAKSVSVTVDASELVPSVTIGGAGTISMYRNQPLSLYATGSISTCAQGSPNLRYVWTVYLGSQVQSGIISSSLNPRTFSLAASKLEAGNTYVVRATVISAIGLSSIYEVSVVVGRRGVKAVLPDPFTIYEQSALSIDGSKSTHLDYPSSVLTYTWSCSQISPSYGGSCGSLTYGTGKTLSFPAGTFISGVKRTFSFTLRVLGFWGYSDTKSVVVTFVSRPLPKIYVGPRAIKYDPFSPVEIVCFVESTFHVQSNWSSPNIILSDVASTQVGRTFAPGKQSFYLGIRANTLQAGIAYAMTVSVGFVYADVNSVGSSSAVILNMNSPPRDGILTVDPLSGTTLKDKFALVASSWVDDSDDYPLTYEFKYYSFSDTSQSVVRSKQEVSDAVVYLPLGQVDDNYSGHCIVYVRDIYNTPASWTVDVTVEPLIQNELSGAIRDILAEARQSFDASKVTSVIASVMALLDNTDINRVPPSACSVLNRRPQTNTPGTCGICKPGYDGIEGHSNSLCVVSGNRRLATAMTAVVDKTCPGDCSGRGTCALLDFNRVSIDTCLEDDPYCRAECVCSSEFTGQYCGVAMANLTDQMEIRSTLCESINTTLGTRDIDAAVMTSISDSIGEIFADISLVDEETLGLCTNIIFDLVRDYPVAATDHTATTSIVTLLSSVVDSPFLSTMMFDGIRDTMVLLGESHQQELTIASEPFSLLLPNIRFMVALAYSADYASGLYRPRFFVESFDDLADDFIIYRPSNDTFGAVSGLDILGVSLIEFLTDARGFTEGTNLIIGSTDYNLVGGGDRRLDVVEYLEGLVVLARVEHNTPLVFPYTPAETVISWCHGARSPYLVYIYCGDVNASFPAECPGNEEGFFNFTCPSITTLPVCTRWDGTSFSPDPQCEVLEFDADFTRCECNLSSSDGGRRLEELNSLGESVVEHSMKLQPVWSDEVVTFVIVPSSGSHNYDFQVVLIGVSVGTFCCLIGNKFGLMFFFILFFSFSFSSCSWYCFVYKTTERCFSRGERKRNGT